MSSRKGGGRIADKEEVRRKGEKENGKIWRDVGRSRNKSENQRTL